MPSLLSKSKTEITAYTKFQVADALSSLATLRDVTYSTSKIISGSISLGCKRSQLHTQT